MKIVIDARFLSARGTGVASYVEGLIRGIKEIMTLSGDEYIFIVPEGFDYQNQNIKIKISNIPAVTMRQHLFMAFHLLALKPDIYHYPHFDLPFSFKIKPVITIHDLKYVIMPNLFARNSKPKSLVMKNIMKNSIRRAKKVIADSESTKGDIVNILKVPSDKIDVIYLAYDPIYRKVTGLNRNILAKYNIRLPFLLFVGEIRPHKNVTRLLYAFKNMKKKNFQLVIVGKSYADYRVPFDLVNELGVMDRVKYLNLIPKEDLLHLYNAAALFVLPSLYEGFGLPVLEAMACGTPVITSNVSSLPEVAGNAALLVNPLEVDSLIDAMDRILASPFLQKLLIRRGLKQVKKFSWVKTARKTIQLYHAVHNEIK